MGLEAEIYEQPAVLSRLLESQAASTQALARAIRSRAVSYVFLAARGTSDNAGLYAKYLWGSANGFPVALAAPSLFSLYGRPPRLEGALVVGISQSGQSPDILSVMVEARRQRALTVAITNDPRSPLAEAADFVLDISAGPETAVAATKTYTAQLMAIAMLSAELSEDQQKQETLRRAPDLVEKALALDREIEQAAERYRYMTRCVVLGRGYNYATAYEWSLKLKELTYVVADPYSSADFLHGPIAIVEVGFPIFAVAVRGAVLEDVTSLLRRLDREHRAELLAISNDDQVLSLARTALPLPAELPEWISPLVCIVPAQLFAYHLTRAKGWDTERPRGLSKVTRTQ
jgi:glucosamine--fructose-6-phosphate aminotransferase (isomerizing)